MLKKIRWFWKRILGLFSKRRQCDLMAEYNGRYCKVYLTNGVCLVGTVQCYGDLGWMQIQNRKKCCKVRISQIFYIGEV